MAVVIVLRLFLATRWENVTFGALLNCNAFNPVDQKCCFKVLWHAESIRLYCWLLVCKLEVCIKLQG